MSAKKDAVQFKFYRLLMVVFVIALFVNNVLPHPGDLLQSIFGLGTSADVYKNEKGRAVDVFNVMYYLTGSGIYLAIVAIVVFLFNEIKEKSRKSARQSDL